MMGDRGRSRGATDVEAEQHEPGSANEVLPVRAAATRRRSSDRMRATPDEVREQPGAERPSVLASDEARRHRGAERPFVIALDGPAASGKSSVGRGVAHRLGFRYFDTGLLYRVLTWLALDAGLDASDGSALKALIDRLDVEVDADGRVSRHGVDITPRLHQKSVDRNVSAVSEHAEVRRMLVPVQRSLIQPPGLVMAGRDIGTVIVPDAQLKI